MTTARARRYPQPPPVAELLAAERCDHGEITGRCALCRRAADQDQPPPTETRPPRPRAGRHDDQDRRAEPEPVAPPTEPPGPRYGPDDPRTVPWWDR